MGQPFIQSYYAGSNMHFTISYVGSIILNTCICSPPLGMQCDHEATTNLFFMFYLLLGQALLIPKITLNFKGSVTNVLMHTIRLNCISILLYVQGQGQVKVKGQGHRSSLQLMVKFNGQRIIPCSFFLAHSSRSGHLMRTRENT